MTVVAIDGPAGSGKSTIAAALAQRLGLAHVDTGAYYRAATLAVLRAGVSVDDGPAVAAAVAKSDIERRGDRTYLDGVDVEVEIRGPEVTAAVSSVSRHSEVRSQMRAIQRAAAQSAGAVVEGRDAGTVVVPDANLKVWLTASPQERARRRAAQLGEADEQAVVAQAAAIARRDTLDATQMVPAADAVEVDTTRRTVTEIIDEIGALLESARTERA